ncbi:uncharacterized protein IUM83_02449 [Phytophthora cinnamomi]|uniref:uncharacterized protein n=1 Tax=Phytophthora cinnamomi TaxID=4785 RepID=UPI0035595383|nr:hypothetical protein IUM83_02449 [Phytophthora cinnamomi]
MENWPLLIGNRTFAGYAVLELWPIPSTAFLVPQASPDTMSSDTSSSSKRTLDSSDSDDTSTSKRACTIANIAEVDFPPSVELPVEFPKLPLEWQRLDTLWLTPVDVVLQAAASGQVVWLTQLLRKFKGHLAAAVATSDGNFEAVRHLLQQLEGPRRQYFGSNANATVNKAVWLAARNGHWQVVELLLNTLGNDGEIDGDVAWEVLEEAAASGQLATVQFVTRYVIRSKEDEDNCADSEAVSRAIAGGHGDVVAYLLRYPWNLASAFMEAMEREQHAVADKIYQVFPFYFEGKNLFVEMAGDGFLTAVKYIYQHGHKSENVIQDAFVRAATTRRMKVLEFLLGTGRVSLKSFDMALEAAASSGSYSMVTFLYEKHFASLQGIYRAFEKAGSLSVIKYLYTKENIPAQSITIAFQNVTGIGSTTLVFPRKEREAVAAFLYSHRSSMTPDVLCTAFAMTTYDLLDLVTTLYGDPSISREVVCAALQNASGLGHLRIVHFLMDKPEISQSVKQVALMFAARNNHNAAIQLLEKGENWSLTTLNEAIKATSSPRLKQFLRGMIEGSEVKAA